MTALPQFFHRLTNDLGIVAGTSSCFLLSPANCLGAAMALECKGSYMALDNL